MKYHFVVNYYKTKVRHNSLLFQLRETPQEFVNRHASAFGYATIVNIENEDIKIISNAVEDNSDDGFSSKNFKVSDIKEISFRKYFNGNAVLMSVMSFLIIAMIFFMIYFFNNYSALFLIVFLGFILYSILGDIIELMVIERKNGEQIFIPINKTIDKIMGYGTEDIVDRFLKEVLEKNPQVIIQKNIHKKHK